MGTVLGYLIVEGAHDIAVVEKILAIRHGFAIVRKRSELDQLIPKSDWLRLIDHDRAGLVGDVADDDIVSRRHVPYFMKDATDRVVIIDPANGDSGLAKRHHIANLNTPMSGIVGWGIVVDADRALAADRLTSLRAEIPSLPAQAGVSGILTGTP